MIAHVCSPYQSDSHEPEHFGGSPPNNPHCLPVLLDQIPDELRAVPRWVTWRYGEPRPNGKLSKVPHDTRTGDRADYTSPSSWSPFDVAVERQQRDHYDGVGVVLNGDGLIGIDMDDVRDPTTGDLDPWTEEIIASLKTYAEVSPSHSGLRLFAFGELPRGQRRRGPVEMYDRKRFLTVTGWHLDRTPATVEQRPGELLAVWRRFVAGDAREGIQDDAGRATAPLISLGDAEVVRRAKAAKNGALFSRLWDGDWTGYPSHSEGDLALTSLLAFWCGPDHSRIDALFRQSGLMRQKWNRADYRQRTLARACNVLSTWRGSTPPLPPAKAPPSCGIHCAPNPPKRTFQVDGNWQTSEIAKEVQRRVRRRRGVRVGALAEARLLVLVQLLHERNDGRAFPLATRWTAEVLGTTETTARRAIQVLVKSGRLVRVAGDAERRRERLADEYTLMMEDA